MSIVRFAKRVVAQFGSALDWGSRGRWFESSPPDQKCLSRSEGMFSDLLCYVANMANMTRLTRWLTNCMVFAMHNPFPRMHDIKDY